MSDALKTREALADLLETLKLHKASVLNGMTKREIELLMDAMHKGNAALSALDHPSGVRMGRDEIANIIDPHSFIDIPFTDDPVLLDMVEQSKQDALRKADRILSALDLSAIGAEGWRTQAAEPGQFAERVVAACRAYMNTYDVLADEVREHMQISMADALRASDAMLAAAPSPPEPRS